MNGTQPYSQCQAVCLMFYNNTTTRYNIVCVNNMNECLAQTQCSDQYVQSCVLDFHCVYFIILYCKQNANNNQNSTLFYSLHTLSHLPHLSHIDGPLWEALCLSGVNHNISWPLSLPRTWGISNPKTLLQMLNQYIVFCERVNRVKIIHII